jgi:hypothetical protein
MTNPVFLRSVIVNGEVHLPTRQEVRAYVAQHVEEVKAHAERGGNPHHLLLDHQDQLGRFAATLPQAQREQFMRIYTEETAAALESIKAAVAEKDAREVGRAQGASGVIWVVLVVLTFALVPVFLRAC